MKNFIFIFIFIQYFTLISTNPILKENKNGKIFVCDRCCIIKCKDLQNRLFNDNIYEYKIPLELPFHKECKEYLKINDKRIFKAVFELKKLCRDKNIVPKKIPPSKRKQENSF
jgi:hypothetical protein